MTKKQLGIYIQIFGVILWLLLGKAIGVWAAVIGITVIFIGGYLWRTGKGEAKK
jgi:hypothetical protein